MEDKDQLVKQAKFLIRELSAMLTLVKDNLDEEIKEKMNELIKKWNLIQEKK